MDFDVIPVVRTLSADTLTPLVAFAALTDPGTEAFLFESVERGENLGRYSFVGFEPRRNLRFDATVSDPVRLLNDELVPLGIAGDLRSGRCLECPAAGGHLGRRQQPPIHCR